MAKGWFVGRHRELSQLATLVADVSEGVGGVVLVEGEQGIGKTSLLRAGLADADAAGCRAYWAAADELLRRFPLRLMSECLGGATAGPGFAATAAFGGDPVVAAMEEMLAEVDSKLAAEAAEAAETEAAAGAKSGTPVAVKEALAGHCRGLIDDDPGLLQSAAAYLAATGRPLPEAAAREDAAELLATRGDTAAARRALTAASEVYARLGANLDSRRAAARLQPFGIIPRRGAARPRPATGWAALTPTELKVARLVAEGHSNPDIAAQLFLSRNTVQTHVSHILAKLNARSRAQVIAEAFRHPSADGPGWL